MKTPREQIEELRVKFEEEMRKLGYFNFTRVGNQYAHTELNYGFACFSLGALTKVE